MKTFSELMADDSMYYRHILTFNFSNDETRSSFMDLVNSFHYVEAEDQSTYVLPYDVKLKIETICEAIISWSNDKDISIGADDFVQIFYLCLTEKEDRYVRKIASKYLEYNVRTKGLAIR